ncbi:hypothetical protein [Streptomyces sp. NBC_00443]
MRAGMASAAAVLTNRTSAMPSQRQSGGTRVPTVGDSGQYP